MVQAFGATDPGCVRTNNEDSYLVAPEVGLFIVADGMGGAQAGELASQLAVKTMSQAVEASGGNMSPEELITAVQHTNQTVQQAASQNSAREGMGTTLVTLLERNGNGQDFLLASVGDSRAYQFANGKLEALTDDQSWVNEVGRRIGLDDETLRTHRMRNVLTMAIGVSQPLRVNSYQVSVEPGTEILLSTDGLHGVLTDEEIQAILSEAGTLEDRCRKLIETTRAKGAPDNVTVILVRSTDGNAA